MTKTTYTIESPFAIGEEVWAVERRMVGYVPGVDCSVCVKGKVKIMGDHSGNEWPCPRCGGRTKAVYKKVPVRAKITSIHACLKHQEHSITIEYDGLDFTNPITGKIQDAGHGGGTTANPFLLPLILFRSFEDCAKQCAAENEPGHYVCQVPYSEGDIE